MITWRRELHFECEGTGQYNPDCSESLLMDQVDANTKRGMFAIAKTLGWTRDASGNCWCPSCSKILAVNGGEK